MIRLIIDNYFPGKSGTNCVFTISLGLSFFRLCQTQFLLIINGQNPVTEVYCKYYTHIVKMFSLGDLVTLFFFKPMRIWGNDIQHGDFSATPVTYSNFLLRDGLRSAPWLFSPPIACHSVAGTTANKGLQSLRFSTTLFSMTAIG